MNRTVLSRALLALALAACALTSQPAAAVEAVKHAQFEREHASRDAQSIANWALASADNQGRPFVIVDKAEAKVFVFDGKGQLRGAAAALVGLARGDGTVPGIGQRKLSTIRPFERTTPAGRFVASLALSLHGDEILWVDYDAAIALHRVVDLPHERRLQRLASVNPLERRITYGCINVPVAFFDDVVRTTFKGTSGIVYVLPETRSLREVFGSYDAQEAAGRSAGQEETAYAPVH